eukprot:TRINITY_DN1669_c0_g1_i23.p3 TRINITY_DN1669_c0_g1~~TRINITY_DN1669_c0_g1_i23.p3  ORF type:complete len:100 (+),score=14.98 TRINITY_DN1669_c0_g1_i23:1258-1557(+)
MDRAVAHKEEGQNDKHSQGNAARRREETREVSVVSWQCEHILTFAKRKRAAPALVVVPDHMLTPVPAPESKRKRKMALAGSNMVLRTRDSKRKALAAQK